MTIDQYLENDNLPPGFKDEGIVVSYSGTAIGSLSRLGKLFESERFETRKRALASIYGSNHREHDEYRYRVAKMNPKEREAEELRVKLILKGL